MQKDDLIKLFNRDHLARLDNIKQWLEYDRHQQESVSQHSYKVSVFTMCLLVAVILKPLLDVIQPCKMIAVEEFD